METQVLLVNQEALVPLDPLVNQVHKDRKDPLDHEENPDLEDLRAPEVMLDWRVLAELQGLKASLVLMEKLETKDPGV